MRKVLKFLLPALLLAALSGISGQAESADAPILSLKRLSLGAGLDNQWFAKAGVDATLPAFDREWGVGLYGAYNLTGGLSLTGSSVYGMDNRWIHSKLGVRLRIFAGSKEGD